MQPAEPDPRPAGDDDAPELWDLDEIFPPLRGSKPDPRPVRIQPPDRPATDLWERKIIRVALEMPDTLEGDQGLRALLKPEWFTRREHQLIWAAIQEVIGPDYEANPRAALQRLEQHLVGKGLDPVTLNRFMFAIMDDTCAAPARANVNYYAACLTANSPQPGDVLDALSLRLGALTYLLGRAA